MLELLVGASAAAAAVVGVRLGLAELRGQWQGEALAADAEPRAAKTVLAAEPTLVEAAPQLPVSQLDVPRRPMGVFHGVSDEVLLEPLRSGTPTQFEFNRGGSSISLRVDFDNGSRAAFKPRQINLQSVPRREIAAFRINRLLGLSSVQPAIGRAFPIEDLFASLDPDSEYYRPRMEAEIVAEDGLVVGELSWWIPVIERARVDGYEIDSVDGIVSWKRFLTVGNAIPHADRDLVAQISDMVLFDFVINNSDRWSGGNVRASADGRVLYFMDNTLSFGNDTNGHMKVRTYLERCQKFSRALVSRLRQLDERGVREALEHDRGPFEFLLDSDEIAALLSRRDLALEYIDGLIDLHGESAVLVFP